MNKSFALSTCLPPDRPQLVALLASDSFCVELLVPSTCFVAPWQETIIGGWRRDLMPWGAWLLLQYADKLFKPQIPTIDISTLWVFEGTFFLIFRETPFWMKQKKTCRKNKAQFARKKRLKGLPPSTSWGHNQTHRPLGVLDGGTPEAVEIPDAMERVVFFSPFTNWSFFNPPFLDRSLVIDGWWLKWNKSTSLIGFHTRCLIHRAGWLH